MWKPVRAILWTTATMAWAAALMVGGSRLWRYEAAAGPPARAPITWPRETRVVRDSNLPTLVMLAHPHCPCSRASIEELSKLMTRCHGKLAATVLMIRPEGMSEQWTQTDLWCSAAAIPGVTVVADERGNEARRFGATTSGATMLFSREGRLLFSGGITESRAHIGDNAGRTMIVALALNEIEPLKDPAATAVFGCPLFDPSSCLEGDSVACHN